MLLPCGGENLHHGGQALVVQTSEGIVQDQGHPRPCEEQLRQGKAQGKIHAVLSPCGKVITIAGDPVFVPQFHGKAGIHGEGTVFSSRGGGKIGFRHFSHSGGDQALHQIGGFLNAGSCRLVGGITETCLLKLLLYRIPLADQHTGIGASALNDGDAPTGGGKAIPHHAGLLL